MSSQPLISVIVPCYNQDKYLGEALQSLYDQTYSNWECIIVNDGALDKTAQVAQSWVDKDNRYRYIYQANKGLSTARNLGLENIKGEYVQFLDADDLIEKDKFELSLSYVPDNDIIVSHYSLFSNKREKSSAPDLDLKASQLNFESVLYDWDEAFVIPIHCALFKSTLFASIHFNENLKAKEDWVMWVEIFQQPVNTIFIDMPLALYRHTGQNMSHQGSFMNKNLVTAFQVIYAMIPTENQQAFFNKAMRMLGNRLFEAENLMDNIKRSNSYKLGNFFLNPLKKLF